MANSSHTKSPRLSWVASHLAIAEAVLDLQVRVNAITQELSQKTTPGSTSRCISVDWERLARTMEAARDALANPATQKILAVALPLLVAIVKWLRNWLGT